ncbi:MAG: glycosyltransferase family 4 protein [Candidatus Cloacimonetes bacterium]|nr:glycosyltransferase family 4 protein [Candidatus Cloacimonadota bacterium]
MKKIVVVSNTAWSIYNFRLNLMDVLSRKGYQVLALAPEDEFAKKIPFEYHHISINNKGTNPIEDIILFFKFLYFYKKQKPSLILNYTIKPNVYSTFASQILKIPCINNITGLGSTFTKTTGISTVTRLLYRISAPFASQIFFQNKDDYSLFQALKIVSKKRVDVIPGSGVDTNKYKPVKRDNEEKFIFLLFARLLWEKGVGEYIEAAKNIQQRYNNLEFQILGFLDVANPSAITKNEIDDWVNRGVIKYLGSTCDVRYFIARADCIVLPSYYREGIPKSLLEAASMEKPIITTNNIGCKEVVDDGINGFLCNIKDPNDLTEKIERMVNLPEEERINMGKKGRRKILRKFDEKIVIEKYLDSIKKILEPINKGFDYDVDK